MANRSRLPALPTSATVATTAAIATATAATTAAVTTAATAAVTAATTATATGSLGTRFGDVQRTSVHHLIVQLLDGCFRFRVGSHFHEPEAFGTARVTVHDHFCGFYRTGLSKVLLKTAIGSGIGKVPHVQFLAHDYTPNEGPFAGESGRTEVSDKLMANGFQFLSPCGV